MSVGLYSENSIWNNAPVNISIDVIIAYEPQHVKTHKMTCVPSKDSDQSLRCPPEESLGP